MSARKTNMDLVSSTLDKYLKHRFNGNGVMDKTSVGTRTVATTSPPQQQQPNLDNNNVPTVLVTPQTINLPTPCVSHDMISYQEQNLIDTPATQTTHLANNRIISLQPSQTNDNSESHNKQNHEEQPKTKMDCQSNANMTNGVSDTGINTLPTIHRVSISNNRPCCVSIRDDLKFLAAGFENSHIYVWHSKDNIITPKNTTTMFRLLAHSGPVYCIEFVNNNDEDLMISCSEDTTIRLWCLNTKCNVVVYRGHNYPIWSLAVGSQGRYFASASMDATARLWRLDKMTPLKIFCGHDDDVECVKFHPNEKYIATGSSDFTIRLWSTSDGKMVRLMVGHANPIISLSFLPDGKFLASASQDGIVKIWNLATNCVSKEHSLPSSCAISFSLDQRFVASCGVDNVLRVWQANDTELIEKKTLDLASSYQKLVHSEFHSDKLFVIGHGRSSQNQINK